MKTIQFFSYSLISTSYFSLTTKASSSKGNNNYIGVPPIKLNNQLGGPTFLSPHKANLNLDTVIEPSKKRISFLRIPCSVQTENDSANSIPISCYVDTGAQVSVLSLDAVKKLNLQNQMDKSHSGRAQGVGDSVPIIGKISSMFIALKNGIKLHINDVIILEDTGGVDLLLGLDVLYEYEAQIDLKRNRITFFNEDEMREKVSIEFSYRDVDFVGNA